MRTPPTKTLCFTIAALILSFVVDISHQQQQDHIYPIYCCEYPSATGNLRCQPKLCNKPCFSAIVTWSLSKKSMEQNEARNRMVLSGCWDQPSLEPDLTGTWPSASHVLQTYFKFGNSSENLFSHIHNATERMRIFKQAALNGRVEETNSTEHLKIGGNDLDNELLGGISSESLANRCGPKRLQSVITRHLAPNADLPLFTREGAVIYNRARITFCNKFTDGRSSNTTPSLTRPLDCALQPCSSANGGGIPFLPLTSAVSSVKNFIGNLLPSSSAGHKTTTPAASSKNSSENKNINFETTRAPPYVATVALLLKPEPYLPKIINASSILTNFIT